MEGTPYHMRRRSCSNQDSKTRVTEALEKNEEPSSFTATENHFCIVSLKIFLYSFKPIHFDAAITVSRHNDFATASIDPGC